MMWKMLLALAAVTAVVATAAPAARDPLTGAWVAVDTARDGSTDRCIFSAPSGDGVRDFTLVDSCGASCESGGPGPGAPLTAHWHAILFGRTVETPLEP